MKNINTSFLLALLVNGGFLLLLLLEKTLFSNWVVVGWILNALVFLYLLSLLCVFIEIRRQANKIYLYLALVLNLIGLMVFLNYWFSL